MHAVIADRPGHACHAGPDAAPTPRRRLSGERRAWHFSKMDHAEEQEMELQALEAIYMDDFKRVGVRTTNTLRWRPSRTDCTANEISHPFAASSHPILSILPITGRTRRL